VLGEVGDFFEDLFRRCYRLPIPMLCGLAIVKYNPGKVVGPMLRAVDYVKLGPTLAAPFAQLC
jgi:hypothetical protein